MTLTIGQVSEKTGLTTHTLRYYEKEGLISDVKRSDSGIRLYVERNLRTLDLIDCLKSSGMPLKDIKDLLDFYVEGDEAFENRLDIMEKHKIEIERQQKEYNRYMDKVVSKIKYYKVEQEKLK